MHAIFIAKQRFRKNLEKTSPTLIEFSNPFLDKQDLLKNPDLDINQVSEEIMESNQFTSDYINPTSGITSLLDLRPSIPAFSYSQSTRYSPTHQSLDNNPIKSTANHSSLTVPSSENVSSNNVALIKNLENNKDITHNLRNLGTLESESKSCLSPPLLSQRNNSSLPLSVPEVISEEVIDYFQTEHDNIVTPSFSDRPSVSGSLMSLSKNNNRIFKKKTVTKVGIFKKFSKNCAGERSASYYDSN